jgi:hypothetical protein
VDAFPTARDAKDQFSSTLYQTLMTDFIREGHFARHIRRMRMPYNQRRTALVEAIHKQRGHKREVIGAEADMYLVALPRRYAVARPKQEQRHESVNKLFGTTRHLCSRGTRSSGRIAFRSSEGQVRCFGRRKRGSEGHDSDRDQVERDRPSRSGPHQEG